MHRQSFCFLFHLFVASLLLTAVSTGQNPVELENWHTYSSLLNSLDSDVDSQGRVWITTNGGIYSYNPADGSFDEFRNINGLLSLDVTCVAANREKKEIYFGTFDGIVEILTEDYEWTHITDIVNSNYPDRRINDIIFNNGVAYICGGFGLTTFDVEEKVFLQTPGRLGSFQPLTTANMLLIKDNVLWVATDEGIAAVDLSVSIINPNNWRNYTTENGLIEKKIKGIVSVNNEIYCFADTSIYKFTDTAFTMIKSTIVWDKIQALAEHSGKLIYATLFSVRDLNDNFLYKFDDIRDTALINNINVNPKTDELRILLKDAGFVFKRDVPLQIKPESPVSNLFTNLDVDINGNLWCATDYTGGKGFMRLNKGKWLNFTLKEYPEILTNSYGRVTCLPDGRVLLSSWGEGFLTLTQDEQDYQFKITSSDNSCLSGLPDNAEFVVTGESAYDRRSGRIWIINLAPNYLNNLLMGQNKAGEYYCAVTRSSREFIPLVIDYSGTKWAGSINGYGLVYFNEGNDFNNPDDDIEGIYTRSNSQLPSNTINSLTVDKNDVIWVATPNGLGYILSPSAVLRNANPIIKPISLAALAHIPINDVMVDALNNKWVATNDGVYVIDPDGGTELAHFTTDNSPLITNEIIALATDPNTGKIWFGSRKGLSEAQSFAVQPLDSYNITCYPQPYNPERDGNLTIEGLAENTDLRILTIDGKLMKNLQTTSQKVVWDGKDEYGNYVPSGVYLIIGTSLSTDSKGIAKFAVVRN